MYYYCKKWLLLIAFVFRTQKSWLLYFLFKTDTYLSVLISFRKIFYSFVKQTSFSSLFHFAPFIYLFGMHSQSYNHFHHILTPFDALANFLSATSETRRNYYLQTWYIRVASRVAVQLKTKDFRKLGKIRELSKPHRMIV